MKLIIIILKELYNMIDLIPVTVIINEQQI